MNILSIPLLCKNMHEQPPAVNSPKVVLEALGEGIGRLAYGARLADANR
jgi:hypothetical protein